MVWRKLSLEDFRHYRTDIGCDVDTCDSCLLHIWALKHCREAIGAIGICKPHFPAHIFRRFKSYLDPNGNEYSPGTILCLNEDGSIGIFDSIGKEL